MKEQVARADPKRANFDKLSTEVCEKPEQRMVRLGVATCGHSRTERLTCASVTKSASAVAAVVQQLGYDAVSWVRQGL